MTTTRTPRPAPKRTRTRTRPVLAPVPTVPDFRLPTLPRFEDVATELGFAWPRPDTSHAAMLIRLDHALWLEEWEAKALGDVSGLRSVLCPCGHTSWVHDEYGADTGCAGRRCTCTRSEARVFAAAVIARRSVTR